MKQFMHRFLFSKEYLDMTTILMGLRSKELPNPDHKFLVAEVFDVMKDNKRRKQFFDEFMKKLNPK